ncbi:MAG: hypothetical protein POH28_07455 [Acidocella sp.]|nr:hypothetical protein [Acidocella sp.]
MRFRYLIPLMVLALAGCSSAPPPNFQALDYSYLPPIVLKVSTLNVVNNYVPDPGAATLIGQDPAPPATTLLNMLNNRIVASGAPGTATVTVQTASIDQVGSNLTGTMTVDINVSSPDGRSTGYTEASVSASQTAPDPDASASDVQAALYALTKRLMDDMNVQLQYQIQHNLTHWLSWSATPGTITGETPGATPVDDGSGPATGAILATPLTSPTPSAGNGMPPPNTTVTSPSGTPPAPPLMLPDGTPATLPAGTVPVTP